VRSPESLLPSRLPIHVLLDVGRVIAQHGRDWVVEKFAEGGRIAARFDPRRRRIGDR